MLLHNKCVEIKFGWWYCVIVVDNGCCCVFTNYSKHCIKNTCSRVLPSMTSDVTDAAEFRSLDIFISPLTFFLPMEMRFLICSRIICFTSMCENSRPPWKRNLFCLPCHVCKWIPSPTLSIFIPAFVRRLGNFQFPHSLLSMSCM